MYAIYFLRSTKNNDLYVGSAEDVEIRLARHNAGLVRSTKAYRPWELLGFEECATRSEAVQKERFYKSHQQKEILKRKYGGMVKG